MVTTGTLYLDKVTFPVIVIENTFSSVGIYYLLPVTTPNKYPSSDSNRNLRIYIYLLPETEYSW